MMMYKENLPEKKVIRASAGTGKTYRLSLEFITLLIKYRGYTTYDEILVLTFTKKATAEIRQRIFSQIKEIILETEEGKSLLKSIANFEPEIVIGKEEITYLKNIYHQMLGNKDKLRVNTIDSFTNTVFNGLIAPYHNISDPQIDPKINEQHLPELFEELLSDQHLQYFDEIFAKSGYRNLDMYKDFIESVINNRWIFNFMKEKPEYSENQEAIDFENYCQHAENFLNNFITNLKKYLEEKSKPIDWNKFIITKYRTLIVTEETKNYDLAKMQEYLLSIFTNKKNIEQNYPLLLETKFWSGGTLFRGKIFDEMRFEMQEEADILSEKLAKYLYSSLVKVEQMQLYYLANVLLKKYDEIKMRTGIFTYSDITYYTYRYLYDPKLSVVEGNNLLNLFYEQLSYKTRYILIDEFQDTSILQWNIINPIIKEAISGVGQKGVGGAIIVGDEKQSIYGWRGGERKLLVQAPQLIEMKRKPETLSTSYRSKKNVVDSINRIFMNDELHQHLKEHNTDWQYPLVESADKSESGYFEVNLLNCGEIPDLQTKKSDEEYFQEILINQIIPLLNSGKINPAKTVILARKNRYMDIIARILDENGIDYLLESSASLLHHRAIKPIIFLLNFFIYDDAFELLKFFRSDLILMDGEKLKPILQGIKKHSDHGIKWNNFFEEYKENSTLSKIFEIKNLEVVLPKLITIIIKQFGFTKIFPTELDMKNMHKFIETAAEFSKINSDYLSDKTGFSKFCRAIEDKTEFTQLGLSDTEALKLMTIHKSKGLEFETVFAFIDGNSGRGNRDSGLQVLSEYNKDFSSFPDWAFSYNYNKIIKLAKKNLSDAEEIRNATEELNGIYVQLTRAANNLIIYNKVAINKKSIDKIASGEIKNLSIPKQLFSSLFYEFQDAYQEISPYHLRYQVGNFVSSQNIDIPEKFNSAEINDYFGLPEFSQLEKYDEEISLHPKAISRGNIVHNYLSYIKFDSTENREKAYRKIFADMGTLLPQKDFEKIIKTANNFIDNHKQYFSKERWQKVFNERIFYDKHGNEKRIDRLLVNETEKKILIIDYKTGEIYHQKQMDDYIDLIKNLPFVKNNYSVEGMFLEVR